MRIVTLDLGTTTGWASKTEETPIISGTVNFKPSRYEGGGMRYLRFKQWLTELKAYVQGIDLIAFEEVRARQPSVAADHAYGGFLATLTSWCEHHDVPYKGVPVGTIKKHVTGKGNANKNMVIQAVVDLGHNPTDDNEADALALIHYLLETENCDQ